MVFLVFLVFHWFCCSHQGLDFECFHANAFKFGYIKGGVSALCFAIILSTIFQKMSNYLHSKRILSISFIYYFSFYQVLLQNSHAVQAADYEGGGTSTKDQLTESMEKFRENRLDDEQKEAFDGLPLDTKLSYYQDYKTQQMQRLEYALSQMTKGERAEVGGLTFDQQIEYLDTREMLQEIEELKMQMESEQLAQFEAMSFEEQCDYVDIVKSYQTQQNKAEEETFSVVSTPHAQTGENEPRASLSASSFDRLNLSPDVYEHLKESKFIKDKNSNSLPQSPKLPQVPSKKVTAFSVPSSPLQRHAQAGAIPTSLERIKEKAAASTTMPHSDIGLPSSLEKFRQRTAQSDVDSVSSSPKYTGLEQNKYSSLMALQTPLASPSNHKLTTFGAHHSGGSSPPPFLQPHQSGPSSVKSETPLGDALAAFKDRLAASPAHHGVVIESLPNSYQSSLPSSVESFAKRNFGYPPGYHQSNSPKVSPLQTSVKSPNKSGSVYSEALELFKAKSQSGSVPQSPKLPPPPPIGGGISSSHGNFAEFALPSSLEKFKTRHYSGTSNASNPSTPKLPPLMSSSPLAKIPSKSFTSMDLPAPPPHVKTSIAHPYGGIKSAGIGISGIGDNLNDIGTSGSGAHHHMPSASATLPPLHPSKTSSSVSEDLKNTLLPIPRSDFIGSSFGGSFRESIPASVEHKRNIFQRQSSVLSRKVNYNAGISQIDINDELMKNIPKFATNAARTRYNMELKLNLQDCTESKTYVQNRNKLTKALMYEQVMEKFYPQLEITKSAIETSVEYNMLKMKAKSYEKIQADVKARRVEALSPQQETEFFTAKHRLILLRESIDRLTASMQQIKMDRSMVFEGNSSYDEMIIKILNRKEKVAQTLREEPVITYQKYVEKNYHSWRSECNRMADQRIEVELASLRQRRQGEPVELISSGELSEMIPSLSRSKSSGSSST